MTTAQCFSSIDEPIGRGYIGETLADHAAEIVASWPDGHSGERWPVPSCILLYFHLVGGTRWADRRRGGDLN